MFLSLALLIFEVTLMTLGLPDDFGRGSQAMLVLGSLVLLFLGRVLAFSLFV